MYILTIEDSFKNLLPEPKKVGFNLMDLFKPKELSDVFSYGDIVVENDASYDHLGFEGGNFTYVQHNRLKNGGLEKNKLKTASIQGVIQHIINNSEHKGRYKEKDFYNFNNTLLAKMADNLTLHFPKTKEEILESFNYNKKVNTTAIVSCANFFNTSYPTPDISWFDFYLNNLDKIQIVVVKDEKGIIQGRSYFFYGEQEIETNSVNGKKVKKGEYVKFFNTVYGLPVAQAKIREFFKNEDIVQYTEGCFCIRINFVKQFPPVDCIFVDEENSLLCSQNYKKNGYLSQAYKYRSQRIK